MLIPAISGQILYPNSWLPEANPPPFPDCSVVTHATMAVTSTVFNFDIDGSYGDDLEEFDSICDDQRLMVKVKESPTALTVKPVFVPHSGKKQAIKYGGSTQGYDVTTFEFPSQKQERKGG